MPIHRSTDKEGTFFQWGTSGKKFYFDPGSESSRTRALNLAKKQQKAIYASGYKGDKQRMKLIKVIKKDSSDAWLSYLRDARSDLSRVLPPWKSEEISDEQRKEALEIIQQIESSVRVLKADIKRK